MTQTQPVQTIDYATIGPLSGARLWAAAVLAMMGLGLIGLGGCFLIGVLIMLYPPLGFGPNVVNGIPPWTWGTYVFAGVLWLVAAGCLIFGLGVLWSTAKRLLRSVSAVQVESMEQAR